MKTIELTIHKGCVEADEIPTGVRVVIRDYDIHWVGPPDADGVSRDENGAPYEEIKLFGATVTCPHCGREIYDADDPFVCPSDDCPSHHEARPWTVLCLLPDTYWDGNMRAATYQAHVEAPTREDAASVARYECMKATVGDEPDDDVTQEWAEGGIEILSLYEGHINDVWEG